MLPLSPLPPEDDVQSLLTRAAAAHVHELNALREENQVLKRQLLDDSRFDISKSALQNLGPHSGDTSAPPLLSDSFQSAAFSTKETWDEEVSQEQISITAGPLGAWTILSNKLLRANVSFHVKSLTCSRVWKRWLLLSDHLIRVRTEGEDPLAFKAAQISFDFLPIWAWRCPRGGSSTDLQIYDSPFGGQLSFQRAHIRTTFRVMGEAMKDQCEQLNGIRIHPHSKQLIIWAFLGGAVSLYELYMIPLDLCDLATSPSYLSSASTVFWMLDFFMCCITGLENKDGTVDLRMKSIMKAYWKSWLIPDLFVLLIDLLLLVEGGGSLKEALRANRVLRLVRLARVLRLRKATEAFQKVIKTIYADFLIMIGNCVKYILVIFTMNHYIACAWYGLATFYIDTGTPTWLHALGRVEDSNAAAYVYSLHWALTQVSPSTQNICPQNPLERVFALLVAMVALVSYSFFLGKLSSALNQIFLSRRKKGTEEALLRDFLLTREISTALGSRIILYFHNRYDSLKDRLTEEDISFFAAVPQTMMLLLHEEMYLDVLLGNICFQQFRDSMTRSTMLKICHTAMRELSAHACQDVFIVGSSTPYIYIITKGNMTYRFKRDKTIRYPGDWMAEMGLWIRWEHVGTLTASASSGPRCDLSAIDKKSLHAIFASGGEPLYEPFRWLAIFTVQQMESEVLEGNLPTDMSPSMEIKAESCRRAETFLHHTSLQAYTQLSSVASQERASFKSVLVSMASAELRGNSFEYGATKHWNT